MCLLSRLGVCITAAVLWSTATPVQAGGIPAKTLKQLKAATVYIKVQFGGAGKPVPVTGSGFVLHVEGDTGYIATNHHVVSPLADEILIGKPKVVFHSGTPNEKLVEGQIVASDPIRDLAVLKITGFKDMPRPIPMDTGIEAIETMPVYAMGFPFGEGLALGASNPGITITKGTISALRYDDKGQIKLLQIDAEINPGNSGGPLVDEKGNLLGVLVSKVIKARTVGFTVPVAPLAEMLQGRTAAVAFDTNRVVDDTAEVRVDVGLIDPMGKLKDLALQYRPVTDADVKQLRSSGKETPVLSDTSTAWLKINNGKGQGRITVKGTGQNKLRIAYQTSVVNAAGKTFLSPIGIAAIDFTQVLYSDRLSRQDPIHEGRPHKLYTHAMKAGKHFVVDMRGNPKDMDPKVIVRDSSGKTLAEDDGSGGLFDALLVFTPPADGDYQILATVNKGEGPFTLRIREETGQVLGFQGWNRPGVLSRSDPMDRVRLAPAQTFNLLLKKGKHYVIDMKSVDFDPYLRLESLSNVNLKNEDIGGGGRSTLFYSPLQDSIFRVIATSYDNKAGRFNIQAREVKGPPRYDIGPAGLKLTGKLTLLDPLDVINGRTSAFRCKVFELQLKAGQRYQFDMVSSQFDPFLRIENMQGRQLAFDDDSGGNLNARMFFTPPADGSYRLIATQFTTQVGAFDLSVKALPQ